MKQPFNELRLELLTVLFNLSSQLWAQKHMSFQPGNNCQDFYDFFFNNPSILKN